MVIPSRPMIPVCSPTMLGNERKYVLDAIDTNWISSSGKYIPLFEEAFAKYCGAKHGIATTSGTTALHLALEALGLKKGDEVIIPNFTMAASAFAVCYTGAKPVFVDADPNTWNIDPKKIEEKITKRTKAIMPVHIYGLPCDMLPILKIAKKHKLFVIEDAAEAHGAEYFRKKVGTFGDIAAFSMFANKVVQCGEGGMVVTNNDKLAEKCRYYKNMCFPMIKERIYSHNHIGFNYRMSNLHAAIGLAQTEKIKEYVKMRIKNNELYRKYLSKVGGIIFQPKKKGFKNVSWMNAILINPKEFGMNRDTLEQKLKEKGIETRRFFIGMNKQSSLKKYGCVCYEKYPISDYLSTFGLYLPSGSNLKEKEIKYICNTIKELAK
jgi:perosamine synthetase